MSHIDLGYGCWICLGFSQGIKGNESCVCLSHQGVLIGLTVVDFYSKKLEHSFYIFLTKTWLVSLQRCNHLLCQLLVQCGVHVVNHQLTDSDTGNHFPHRIFHYVILSSSNSSSGSYISTPALVMLNRIKDKDI